jgi:hypothetical protein
VLSWELVELAKVVLQDIMLDGFLRDNGDG